MKLYLGVRPLDSTPLDNYYKYLHDSFQTTINIDKSQYCVQQCICFSSKAPTNPTKGGYQMKLILRIEISRRPQGKTSKRTIFLQVGETLTKEDIRELFSADEQQEYNEIEYFELRSSFNEDDFSIQIRSDSPSSVKVNTRKVDEKDTLFYINKTNCIEFDKVRCGAQLVVGGGRRT